jgi:hypothetical protein
MFAVRLRAAQRNSLSGAACKGKKGLLRVLFRRLEELRLGECMHACMELNCDWKIWRCAITWSRTCHLCVSGRWKDLAIDDLLAWSFILR